MTVVVAVQKGPRIVVAADSLVNFGGQRVPPENCQFHKIGRVGDSLIACAGWSLYSEMLAAHLSRRPPPVLSTETEVFSFFVSFWRSLQDEYSLVQQSSQTAPFADLDSSFLLANRGGIFTVARDMDVTLFRQYCAIGSGAKFALGALRVLYGVRDDPVDLARTAVQVGIDSDVFCGGPIDVAEVE